MSNWFVIKDSNGRFEGHIGIISNSETGRGDYEWDYLSKTYPTSGNLFRENIELEMSKTKEINALACYNLTWEIVELTHSEIRDLRQQNLLKDKELGISEFISDCDNLSIEPKEIPWGFVGKYRKAVNDIYKKYKMMKKRRIAC